MNTWFRMYNEVHSDPKVQTLPPILFRAWVNLMCLANMNGDVLPPIKDVAYRLHLSEAKAHELILTLIDKNLFEERTDGNIQPHNWNNRQFKSDVSTERVKQFRERQRNVSGTVTETPSDTDTDTDTENPPTVPQKLKRSPAGAGGYSEDFEAFFAAYPKKVGKGAAFIAWKKNGHPVVAQVVATVELAKRTAKWIEDDGRYIPNPATWLNQKRWDDEYRTVDDERQKAEQRQREIYGDKLR